MEVNSRSIPCVVGLEFMPITLANWVGPKFN